MSQQSKPHIHVLGEISDANFPKDGEGRVYHLAVKRGEVANRIVSVGDPQRAAILASLLDNPQETFQLTSKRGFTVYTGRKHGVPISVIATGMGFPMIDFVVRETRAVVDGKMAIVRLGTCGTPQSNIEIGSIAVASHGSTMIQRNPDAWTEEEELATASGNNNSHLDQAANAAGKRQPYYLISKPIPADPALSKLLVEELERNLTPSSTPPSDASGAAQQPRRHAVIEGLNATADSFYSSQGRIDSRFLDHNEDLLDQLLQKYPQTISLEMETGQLLDLGRISRNHSVVCSACTIILAQRKRGDFLDHDTLRYLERQAGEAVLTALTKLDLGNQEMTDDQCVWNKKRS